MLALVMYIFVFAYFKGDSHIGGSHLESGGYIGAHSRQTHTGGAHSGATPLLISTVVHTGVTHRWCTLLV